MTLGLLEMYHKIKEKLRPTPTQAHYVFNLHDVARVIHGILLMSPRSRTRKMMRRKKGDNESSNFHWKKKNIDNSLCFAVFPSISYSVEDEI